MAAEETPRGKHNSAQGTMGCDRDRCVLRTAGHETAAARVERMQRRRYPAAVEREHCEQKTRHADGTCRPGEVACIARAASALACPRIRTISVSSFVNSRV